MGTLGIIGCAVGGIIVICILLKLGGIAVLSILGDILEAILTSIH